MRSIAMPAGQVLLGGGGTFGKCTASLSARTSGAGTTTDEPVDPDEAIDGTKTPEEGEVGP